MNAQDLYGSPLQWCDWFHGYSKDDLAHLGESARKNLRSTPVSKYPAGHSVFRRHF